MSKITLVFYYVVIFGMLFLITRKDIGVAANSPAITYSPSEACFLHCADQGQVVECLRNCSPNWPFVDGGSCIYDVVADENASVACNPLATHLKYKILTKASPSGKLYAYALFSWQPCGPGIVDLRGFQVASGKFQGKFAVPHECHRIQFEPNFTLSPSQKDVTFSFLSSRLLQTLTTTDIADNFVSVQALPPNPDEPSTRLKFEPPSCRDLNGKYSCHCRGSEAIALRQPNVTVDGYTLTVRAIPANKCFGVLAYELGIYVDREDGFGPTVIKLSFSSLELNGTLIHTFLYFYDSPFTLKVEFLANRHSGRLSSTFSERAFNTVAWKPPKPTWSFPVWSAVKVSFQLPTNYSIATYTIRLSKHDVVDGQTITNVTVSVKNVSATDAVHGNLSKIFYGLSEGLYSAQIREVRPHLKTKFYNKAYWGPFSEFNVQEVIVPKVEGVNLDVLLPVVLSATFLTFLIVCTILFLFMWKKKKCLLFRQKLPSQLVEWLDTQTITLSSKTVLLVWQADHRTPHFQEKHTEVISRFAAFLRTVCNLDVILDLYDEAEMRRGIGEWVQKSYAKAEVVVFVCPHFDYASDRHPGVASLAGNFRRMYSYAERDLGDRSKFATALLPYSDLYSSSATEYLRKMTSVFNLMDQLEDLYFHIQGFSKFDCLGRHGAVNINERDYQRTPEGSALCDGIREFKEMLANYSQTSSLLGSSESTDDTPTSSDSRSIDEKNPLMLNRDDSSLDEEEQTPVMIHSLARVEPPSPSDHLVERNRPALQPIAPFVDNPEEELLRINERTSEQMMQEEDFCPYHNRTDVILSSKSLSTVVDPHSLAYGQDSRSFNNIEQPQVQVKDDESERNSPTTSTVQDSGFDSTRV